MNENPSSLPQDLRESVCVVVAAYNEGACVEPVATEVRERYPHLVVVDDGSTDNTAAAAERSGALVIRHAINRGQGAALQTGIEYAIARGAAYVVTFDADGQHRASDIDAMVAPLAAGECDVTLGSRFIGETIEMPAARRLMLKGAVLFTFLVNRVRLTDAHNGLRGFTRDAAGHVRFTSDRMAHATEIIDIIRRAGLRYREVPVQIRYTAYSLAKGQSMGGAVRIVWQYLMGRMFS